MQLSTVLNEGARLCFDERMIRECVIRSYSFLETWLWSLRAHGGSLTVLVVENIDAEAAR